MHRSKRGGPGARAGKWFVCAAAAAMLLSACGSSDSPQTPSVRQPPPTLAQDIVPTGARIDVRADNYFPMGAGDAWSYDLEDGVTITPNYAARSVTSGPDANGNLMLADSSGFAGPGDIAYRVTSDGIFRTNLLGTGTPPGAQAIIGTIAEYPQPFYPVGAARRVIRQGTWDRSIDGDSFLDGFRVEFVQIFRGFETVQVPKGTAQAAHFSNSLVLVITPSDPQQPTFYYTFTEEIWFASNVGPVRIERSVSFDGGATTRTFALALRGVTIAGVPLFVDGTVVNVPLVHSALIYDPVHARYYASIPGSVVATGNRIATIDPQSGAVSYSAPVGSDPGPLALSADGSTLYVALRGSGQVVRLNVATMTPTGSVALPIVNPYGQLLAETMTVSPVDPTVVAVALYRPGVSARSAGIALLRDMVMQPLLGLPGNAGSANLIAFDTTGTDVFGWNIETSEWGLRRFGVLANGLTETQVIGGVQPNAGVQSFEVAGANVVAGRRVFRTGDLGSIGVVASEPNGCRVLAGQSRVVCVEAAFNGFETRLVVADLATLAVLSRPLLSHSQRPFDQAVVPGPAGQVAVRDNGNLFLQPATKIVLFTSPLLQ